MTTKLTLEEFREKADDLMGRMALITELYREADALVKSVNFKEFDDEEQDEAWEIAHEIAYEGGYQIDSFDRGYWLPSTC